MIPHPDEMWVEQDISRVKASSGIWSDAFWWSSAAHKDLEPVHLGDSHDPLLGPIVWLNFSGLILYYCSWGIRGSTFEWWRELKSQSSAKQRGQGGHRKGRRLPNMGSHEKVWFLQAISDSRPSTVHQMATPHSDHLWTGSGLEALSLFSSVIPNNEARLSEMHLELFLK